MTHMEGADLDPNCFIKIIIYVSVLNMTKILNCVLTKFNKVSSFLQAIN